MLEVKRRRSSSRKLPAQRGRELEARKSTQEASNNLLSRLRIQRSKISLKIRCPGLESSGGPRRRCQELLLLSMNEAGG